MRILIICALALLAIGRSWAAEGGYDIKVKVKLLPDTVAYLGYHYGDKKYVRDTARVDKKGMFTFEGPEALKGGLYFFYSKKAYFEFIVDQDQSFSLETDTLNFVGHQKVSGSEANALFLGFQQFMSKKQQEAQGFNEAFKKAEGDTLAQAQVREKLQQLDAEVKSYQARLMKEHPKSLTANLIGATLRPDVPTAPKNEKGEVIDADFPFRYYRQHYFDSLDFGDARLLRTPLYEERILEYLDKLTSPHPDSLAQSAIGIIDRSKANTEVFRYTLSTLASKYESSNIMGHDAIFVKIAEHYYLTGEADWLDSATQAKIQERVLALRPTLIGKKAYNIQGLDSAGQRVPLYTSAKDYTVVYFFDPDCGHCKKKTPELHGIYQKSLRQMGVEVYCVVTTTELSKWKKFIREHQLSWVNANDPTQRFRLYYDVQTTPTIFVIDKDKNIIAKKLDVEQIEDFISNHKKMMEQKQTN
ncbi:MAG: redoxin domain-containing protein [Cytophagales bacterium]|nr:redoxin domain-containing protein [Cytophagales bacterium]